MANFDSQDQEEEWLQDMMSNNSFVFSQEGNDMINNQRLQHDDDEEESYDDNYERKKIEMQEPNYEQNYSTPRGINDNDDESSTETDDDDDDDEDEEDSTTMSDIDGDLNMNINNDINGNIDNNNNYNKNNIINYIAPNYYPNEIEKLTRAKRGHHAELNRYINPWTLTYIGIYDKLDESLFYPKWINYKYESDNTAHSLMLTVIIMILASIHVSFTADITLLVFTIGLMGLMMVLYVAKVIINKKNWKAILIFLATMGVIIIIAWMIFANYLGMKDEKILITMTIGAAIVIAICIAVYLIANNINSIDCYVACTGCAGLYIIIQHTLAANLSTDKFLIYFSLLLFVATLTGYIPFKHYYILIIILWIEYNISGIARFSQYIPIGNNTDVVITDSIHFEYDIQQHTITGYQLIFSNIILLILFTMIGIIVYRKEKENRYEYLEFQFMIQEKQNRAKIISDANIKIHNKQHNNNNNNNNKDINIHPHGLHILPKIDELDGPSDDDESISSLSNEQQRNRNHRRLSDPSNNIENIENIHLNQAIAALPQPIYRLQSNIGHNNPNNINIIDRGFTETSSIYTPTNTNDFVVGGGIYFNRAKSNQLLYQTAKKLIQTKQRSISQEQVPISAMNKIIFDGDIKLSPFDKLGAIFGHMSNCERPQYITRQQQRLFHNAAKNAPEFDGLSNAEKENAMKYNEQEMNAKHCKNELWSITHLPYWYMTMNHCILHGYRNNIEFKTALCSLFCFKHNDLINILIDYILFIIQSLWIFYMCYIEDRFYKLQKLETQIIVLLCLSIGIFRGFISGTSHLFHCMNEEISRKCWNIDFIFLLLFQCVLSMIWIHFIFFCDLHQQILFGFCCIFLSLTSIITAYCSIQPLLKDISIFFAICYNHIFLFGYIVIGKSMKDNDMPWIFILYWFLGFISLIIGCLIKYFEIPEIWFLRKHIRNMLGQQLIVLKDMNEKGKYEEIDKKLDEMRLSRLAYNDKSDKYCIYYFSHSHNLYHIFIHGLLFINIYTFREYLKWRVDNQC